MKKIVSICAFVFAFLVAGNAMAKFTYEGHLTDLSDNPLSNQAGTIKIAVVPPTGSCVVYMESHAILTDNKGFFSVQVGGGTDIDGLANTLDSVFSNSVVLSGMSACSYTPVAGDGRRLKIDVDTGGGFEALGFVALGKSPQAAHADAVGGYNSTSLVRTSGTAPLLSSSDVTSLTQLIAGTSTLYAPPGGGISGVTGTLPISSSGGTTPNITISQASASGPGFLTSSDWTLFNNKFGFSTAISGDLSGVTGSPTVAKIRGYPVSATAPSPGQVLQYNGSVYVPTTPTTAPVVSVAGRTGAVTLGSADISGLGNAAFKNVGTSAGTVAAGDDPRMVNALSNSLLDGQALLGDGTNLAVGRNIFLADVRSAVTPTSPAFSIAGGCSPGDMISYFSPSGQFSCQSFALTNGQVLSALGYSPLAAGGPLLMPLGAVANPTYTFSGDSSTGIFSPGLGELGFANAGVENMRITSSGRVGIGMIAPDSKLSVVGTMRATSISGSSANISSSNVFDFNGGNLITSSTTCGTALTFSNMRAGGIYRIAITDPGTTQCTFDTTVSGLDGGVVTYKFAPANGARTASSDTTYELSRFGNTVYVKWMTF